MDKTREQGRGTRREKTYKKAPDQPGTRHRRSEGERSQAGESRRSRFSTDRNSETGRIGADGKSKKSSLSAGSKRNGSRFSLGKKSTKSKSERERNLELESRNEREKSRLSERSRGNSDRRRISESSKKIHEERQRRNEYAKAKDEAVRAVERRKERQKKAAERRKRQLILRFCLLVAAVVVIVVGFTALQKRSAQKELEPEGGAGTNALAAAEAASGSKNMNNPSNYEDGSQTDPQGTTASGNDAASQNANGQNTGSQNTASGNGNQTSQGTASTQKNGDNTLTICMVGDVILHQNLLDCSNTGSGYDFSGLFANVSSEIRKYDIKIVNQETILGGPELEYSGYPYFNSPYEEADALVNAGFNVVLQATNHTLDSGQAAVQNNLSYWNSKFPNIPVLGVHDASQPSQDIYVYEKDGFRVAILNYTYGSNQHQEELLGGPLTGEVDLLDPEKVYSDIQRAHEMADYIIVCPHWGVENQLEPNSEQENWVRNFLDWGVDLVLGTHPHVIQPIQLYTGQDGHQMLVYYSLGNFVSNQSEKDGNIGAMAQVQLRRNDDGRITLDNYGVRTLVTHEGPNSSYYTTYFLDEYPEDLAANNGVLTTDPEFSSAYAWALRDRIFAAVGKIDVS